MRPTAVSADMTSRTHHQPSTDLPPAAAAAAAGHPAPGKVRLISLDETKHFVTYLVNNCEEQQRATGLQTTMTLSE